MCARTGCLTLTFVNRDAFSCPHPQIVASVCVHGCLLFSEPLPLSLDNCLLLPIAANREKLDLHQIAGLRASAALASNIT